MLFVPDSILETRRKLLLEMDAKTIDPEEGFRQALELDPEDHLALITLGQFREKAGEPAKAEELYWRALQAQPCMWLPYIRLSWLLKDQEALSRGLAELAIRKTLLDPEDLASLEKTESSFLDGLAGTESPKRVSVEETFEQLANRLRELRDLEPVAVTARLHSLRLVHLLQENDDLESGQIDALVQEGESIVPLLVGLLRGWAQDVLEEDDTYPVANSMALLGEIGAVSAIPYLLEMVTLKDPELSGPCRWALNRIVEQNPDPAAKLFSEIVPGLDGQQRNAVVETVVRCPRIVPSVELFGRLFENLDRLDAEDRDACFEIFISTAIMVLGRTGVEFSRTMLRRHGGLLSRKVRRECEDLIGEFSSMAVPPRPPAQPSQWTVYDICAGTADWQAEEEAIESMDDDDEPVPLEPVRRAARPGRNDPCWCGSGKKYKKCHLDSDDASEKDVAEPQKKSSSPAEPEFDDVRRRIGEFMTRTVPKREIRLAQTEFFGTEHFEDEMGPMILLDWLIHDRVSQSLGRTVMEEYLKRNAASLTDRERAFVESSARTYIDLLEVQEVKEGSGLEVKSLTSGETFFVHDISMSKVTARWDGLFARVIDGERGLEFSGTGLRVNRMHLDAVRRWMEEDKRRTGLSWPVYLKGNWPRIRAQSTRIAEEWMDSVRLTNSDGEELVLSKAFYNVQDRDALLTALRGAEKIREDEEGTSFVWLSAEEKGTVLGNFRIAGRQLVLEGNSKQRIKRGKSMLAELAGAAVQFEKDEFTTQEEIKRNARENPQPPRSEKDEIPPEVKRRIEREYMEDYYAKWPDTKLPALDGKTPRQAVKNAAGKRKVAEILKQIENAEAHKRKSGEYAYDVSKLRAELGVKG